MTGVDLKSDVIEYCSSVAKELGYEYSYDAAANVVTITKPAAEEEVK